MKNKASSHKQVCILNSFHFGHFLCKGHGISMLTFAQGFKKTVKLTLL